MAENGYNFHHDLDEFVRTKRYVTEQEDQVRSWIDEKHERLGIDPDVMDSYDFEQAAREAGVLPEDEDTYAFIIPRQATRPSIETLNYVVVGMMTGERIVDEGLADDYEVRFVTHTDDAWHRDNEEKRSLIFPAFYNSDGELEQRKLAKPEMHWRIASHPLDPQGTGDNMPGAQAVVEQDDFPVGYDDLDERYVARIAGADDLVQVSVVDLNEAATVNTLAGAFDNVTVAGDWRELYNRVLQAQMDSADGKMDYPDIVTVPVDKAGKARRASWAERDVDVDGLHWDAYVSRDETVRVEPDEVRKNGWFRTHEGYPTTISSVWWLPSSGYMLRDGLGEKFTQGPTLSIDQRIAEETNGEYDTAPVIDIGSPSFGTWQGEDVVPADVEQELLSETKVMKHVDGRSDGYRWGTGVQAVWLTDQQVDQLLDNDLDAVLQEMGTDRDRPENVRYDELSSALTATALDRATTGGVERRIR